MAESVGTFQFCLQRILKDLSENGKQIDLKREQRTCHKEFSSWTECPPNFTYWFWQRRIYQTLVRVKEKMFKDCACVLVICPLRILIEVR